MSKPGGLINSEKALDLIRSTSDKGERNLLDLVFTAFVKDRFAVGRDGPDDDFDMAYCISVLKTVVSDHDYILGLLAGEEPEKWFDDNNNGPSDRGATLTHPPLASSSSPADATAP